MKANSPKPTPEQQHQLDLIKREFGSALHKTYSISRTTGIMRVKLRAQAGWWHWSFRPDGEMCYSHLDMQLPLEGTDDHATRPSTLPD